MIKINYCTSCKNILNTFLQTNLFYIKNLPVCRDCFMKLVIEKEIKDYQKKEEIFNSME